MRIDLTGTEARIKALENKFDGLADVAESGSYADLKDQPTFDPHEDVIVDSAMSDNSENLVQNKVIKAYVDAGYLYAGVVNKDSDAPTATGKVFVIASTAGTYTNFDNIVVNEGEVAILKYDTGWTKENTNILSKTSIQKKENANVVFVGATGFINENGIISSYGSMTYSDFVRIPERVSSMDISVTVLSTLPQQYTAFYDVNKEFISGVARIQETTTETARVVNIEIPENAKFFRCSYWKEDDERYVPFVCRFISNYLTSLDSRVDEVEQSIDIERNYGRDSLINTGYVVGADGELTTLYASNKGATDYIVIEPGWAIQYSRLNTADETYALNMGLAFYDVNKDFISFVQSLRATKGYSERVVYAPSGARYIRLTGWTDIEGFYITMHRKINGIVSEIERELAELKPSVEKIDNLEPRVDEVEQSIDIERNYGRDSLINTGYVVGADGELTTLYASNKGATDYIVIEPGWAIQYSRLNTADETYALNMGLAFYDVNKDFISFVQSLHATKGYSERVVYAPSGARYIRLTGWTDIEGFYITMHRKINGIVSEIERELAELKPSVEKIDNLEPRVDELEQRIIGGVVDNTLNHTQLDIVEGNAIGNDGEYYANDSMGCTDFIPCHGAATLLYTKIVGITNAGLAFYDVNKSFISYIDSVSGDNGVSSQTIDIPDNAYYFRASGWNYNNSLLNGKFGATLTSPLICVNGKRASNGESTFFSVLYNKEIINLDQNTFVQPCLSESLICTTGVVLLPPNYTMNGKPSRVIVNFHGWSHYVNYKQWGAAGDDYLGFMIQKQRWANAGYVVIDVNHKDSAQQGSYSGLGSIQDDECYKKALEWVQTNYNVEKSCYIVCGSAGGPNGINACYNWPNVNASVWLDTWIDVEQHPYPASCGAYYYGYDSESGYDANKVGTRNPMTRIKTIGTDNYLIMPQCPILFYPLTITDLFMKPFLDIIDNGKAIGDFYIRRCSGITHSNLVSGGDGTDPQSAIVDEEIINFLNQH